MVVLAEHGNQEKQTQIQNTCLFLVGQITVPVWWSETSAINPPWSCWLVPQDATSGDQRQPSLAGK